MIIAQDADAPVIPLDIMTEMELISPAVAIPAEYVPPAEMLEYVRDVPYVIPVLPFKILTKTI